MKIICISAKARHGKDLSAEILKKLLEKDGKHVLIIHYADLLKFICKNYFGWNGEKDLAGRSLLQRIGTNIVTAKHPDYWVDFIAGLLKLFPKEWDYVLIPDCRFPNEYERLTQEFDTILLRIERPNFDNGLSQEQKVHASEVSLDNYNYDYKILNDSTIGAFEQKLIAFKQSELD